MNAWFDGLPDPRCQELCVYLGRHLWWQILLTFLVRDGSCNALDGDRNTGELPANLLQLCEQVWDVQYLGERRTVTCSTNAKKHAARVSPSAVAEILPWMVRRLMQMRLLDSARLFGRWWRIVIDGTLQDRGRATPTQAARYRYVVEAKLVGPEGTMFSLLTEFQDVADPVRDKEDCELNAFLRLTERLHALFPRLPICLLLDGLYPVQSVFEVCERYDWKFIATLREGRQPTAWDEAVQTTLLSPGHVFQCQFPGEYGPVAQTLRWTSAIPFGAYTYQVLFAGEISPVAATLWAWVTNFPLRPQRVHAIAQLGGRARNGIENSFNVQKNDGFGLEHAFCANATAAQNYHLIMQVAYNLSQLLVDGVLRRLTAACRKITAVKLVALLRTSLLTVRIDPSLPVCQQIRFRSTA